jgi:hypothetical protein
MSEAVPILSPNTSHLVLIRTLALSSAALFSMNAFDLCEYNISSVMDGQ